MVNKTDIDARIKTLMDHLQQLMESNTHLDRKEYVLDVIDSAGKYFTAMNEEDKEYLQIARSAVDENRQWNVSPNLIINEDDGYSD